ncbi:hypothetical protein KKA27_00200, partial [Patescibacteria group bacterium]|nr:hypothetical protein [Patescibacteria group bacterium]
ILHTIGNKNIRLVLGYYGTEPNGEEKYGTNHAYCLLMRPDHPNDPYVLDGVGDEILFEMNKLNDIPAYHTLISASAYSKQVWIHGHWIKKYGG